MSAWNSRWLPQKIEGKKPGRGRIFQIHSSERTPQLIFHSDERKVVSFRRENHLNHTKIMQQNDTKHKVLKWHSEGRIQEQTWIKGHRKKQILCKKRKKFWFCYFLQKSCQSLSTGRKVSMSKKEREPESSRSESGEQKQISTVETSQQPVPKQPGTQ